MRSPARAYMCCRPSPVVFLRRPRGGRSPGTAWSGAPGRRDRPEASSPATRAASPPAAAAGVARPPRGPRSSRPQRGRWTARRRMARRRGRSRRPRRRWSRSSTTSREYGSATSTRRAAPRSRASVIAEVSALSSAAEGPSPTVTTLRWRSIQSVGTTATGTSMTSASAAAVDASSGRRRAPGGCCSTTTRAAVAAASRATSAVRLPLNSALSTRTRPATSASRALDGHPQRVAADRPEPTVSHRSDVNQAQRTAGAQGLSGSEANGCGRASTVDNDYDRG